MKCDMILKFRTAVHEGTVCLQKPSVLASLAAESIRKLEHSRPVIELSKGIGLQADLRAARFQENDIPLLGSVPFLGIKF
jgi:hypothetical protein